MAGLRIVPTRYVLVDDAAAGGEAIGYVVEAADIADDGTVMAWAVRHHGECLKNPGRITSARAGYKAKWKDEPSPSNRTARFLLDYRFKSRAEAEAAAMAYTQRKQWERPVERREDRERERKRMSRTGGSRG